MTGSTPPLWNHSIARVHAHCQVHGSYNIIGINLRLKEGGELRDFEFPPF